jgi:hypothetical protein
VATCPCDRRLLGERQRIQFGPDGYRRQQLQEDDRQVVLIHQFNVAPEDTRRFLEVWLMTPRS